MAMPRRKKNELRASIGYNPVPDWRDKDSVLIEFQKIEGLEVLSRRTIWASLSRHTLSKAIAMFEAPEGLHGPLSQVRRWLEGTDPAAVKARLSVEQDNANRLLSTASDASVLLFAREIIANDPAMAATALRKITGLV